MKFDKEELLKAAAGNPQAVAAFAPVIRKCAAAGCSKSNMPEHADDIEQELWLFVMKHAGRFDDKYNIEPYLIEVARRLSLGFHRKFSAFGTEGVDERADNAGETPWGEVEQRDLDDDVDEERATRALAEKSAWLRQASIEKSKNMKKADGSKPVKTKSGNRRSASQERLRKLRLDLGLTQTDMANRLGVKLPTYQAYEYGRTIGVPKRVMEAAKALKGNPDFSTVDERYADKTMQEISLGWCKRLGIDEHKASELAIVLGVNRATVSRWLRQDRPHRMKASEILIHDHRVEREAKRMASANKRRKRNAGHGTDGAGKPHP